MKHSVAIMNKLVVIPAITLAAGISLAACGSDGTPAVLAPPATTPTQAPAAAPAIPDEPTSSAPALTPGSATNGQICQAAVGTTSRYGFTVESATTNTFYINPNAIPTVNESGDIVSSCLAVMSDGTQISMHVTLFPNGSVGWHKI